MLTAIRRRATFANICSLLALTMVLGMGTAYAANTVRSKDIVNGQVKTPDLGGNAVTTAKIKDGDVGAGDIGPGAVRSAEIADSAVGATDLASDSVSGLALQTDSVRATEIADDSIDGGEIIDNSLGSADLGTGSVGASEVADGSLTTADLLGADVSGSITLGAGSVANGRCNFYDVSVAGTAADQAVVISARATLPAGQIVYGVEVPSAGHVTMAACNFSGGAWVALSSFPVRVVTFG